MQRDSRPASTARRDWLKAAGLGGTAAFLGGKQAAAQPVTGATAASGTVRGVVFLVSDGMSPGVLTLAEAYSRLTRKRGTAWWALTQNRAAVHGLMETASASSMVPDSAAAASAWGGGQRVNNGAINVSPAGREVTPIAAILKKEAKARIGLVTTATVTHATPAGFAASVASRGNEAEIASQYLNRVEVILGGGSEFFDARHRRDKRDLRGDYLKAGYEVVESRDELLGAKGRTLLGTFARGYLPYTIDRDRDRELAARIPTLAEMSRAALPRFLAGDERFLLQIEGARVDHAAHLNDIGGLLGDQLAFDDAVAEVLAMVGGRDDVLVVVTSDHGNANPGLNGMGSGYAESTRCFERIQGSKVSHERLFAEWRETKDGDAGRLSELVHNRLGFQLKTEESEALRDILDKREVVEWNHQLDKPEGLLGQFAGNHTGIGWTGTTHTSDPTLVTAIGPQADRFAGMIVSHDVFGHLVEMLG